MLTHDQMDLIADRLIERLSAPVAPVESLTFGELFALYSEKHVKVRCSADENENAFYFWKRHGSRWQDIQVSRIARKDVQAWVEDVGAKSRTSANRAVNILQAVINWGLKRDLLPPIPNPCKSVERFKEVSRERFLSPSELVKLQASLREESDLVHDFFWLCLETAARKNNVQSMSWSEVDFDLATWTIPAAKVKNGCTHTVPHTTQALTILRRRHSSFSGNPWVFPGRYSGHLVETRKAWERVTERAGIVDAHIHDLRRTTGSYLAMNGENVFTIARMLGHKDIRSTSVYARMDTSAVRKAAETVSEKWQRLLALPLPQREAAPLVIATQAVAPLDVQSQSKNAGIKLSRVEQQIIEAKILTVLQAGGNTRKNFYSKIGSRIKVNSIEMERILGEMVARGLIVCRTDDMLKHSVYALCADATCGAHASDEAIMFINLKPQIQPAPRRRRNAARSLTPDQRLRFKSKIFQSVGVKPCSRSELHQHLGGSRITSKELQTLLDEMLAECVLIRFTEARHVKSQTNTGWSWWSYAPFKSEEGVHNAKN